MSGDKLAIALALIAQFGVIAVALIQRYRTKQERKAIEVSSEKASEAAAVDILQDVNSELRLELTRIATDREATLTRYAREVASLQAERDDLRDQLRVARAESRGAHETSGRLVRRVEHLEGVIRQHGIVADPGPLA